VDRDRGIVGRDREKRGRGRGRAAEIFFQKNFFREKNFFLEKNFFDFVSRTC